MTNTDQLREQIADICFTKGSVNKPTVDALAEFIEQHTATAVRAARIDELKKAANHNNSEYTSDYIEQRLDALKKEGSNE